MDTKTTSENNTSTSRQTETTNNVQIIHRILT